MRRAAEEERAAAEQAKREAQQLLAQLEGGHRQVEKERALKLSALAKAEQAVQAVAKADDERVAAVKAVMEAEEERARLAAEAERQKAEGAASTAASCAWGVRSSLASWAFSSWSAVIWRRCSCPSRCAAANAVRSSTTSCIARTSTSRAMRLSSFCFCSSSSC